MGSYCLGSNHFVKMLTAVGTVPTMVKLRQEDHELQTSWAIKSNLILKITRKIIKQTFI